MQPSQDTRWQHAIDVISRRYAERHPGSQDAMRRMAAWLPGGDTRSTTWFAPFPLVMSDAAGARMHDVDGHELLDFLGNYTALVHGHRPLTVERALLHAIPRSILFGAPMPEQGALAQHLVERLASAERIRFCNSGTEATMLAARLARQQTGRRRLAVAQFSYHGSYEDLVWSACDRTGTALFPPDDADAAERALRQAGPLAAIFIEPVLGSGGIIRVPDDVLARLRHVADDTGAVLVFDEVMSFRLGYGGAQETAPVVPDLTTLGKIIGGGMPIGAVAGDAAILGQTDPNRPGHLEHGGTFNGHRLAMVAGLAAMEALDRGAIERLNVLGGLLADGLSAAAADSGLPVSVTAVGSLLNLHAAADVHTPGQAEEAAGAALRTAIHLGLLDRGVFLAPRCEMCCSTAMRQADIDSAVAAARDTFSEILSLSTS